MTDQEINIKIAEDCGWKREDVENNELLIWSKEAPNNIHFRYASELPNYCNDLNAMREAEQALTGPQQLAYQGHLSKEDIYCHWLSITATAKQRALAFIKTIES